jgi:hypothetical protein
MAISDRPYGPTSGAASVANQIPLNQQATQTQTLAGVLPVQLILVSGGQRIVMSAPNAIAPLSIQIPPDTQIEQTVFDLWASGVNTTTAAGTITIGLYEGSDSNFANNTLLGGSGAIAQAANITAAWFAHAQLIFDSVSETLAGTIEFYVNKTLVAKTTLTDFPTGFLNQGNPSANPPTVANLPSFTLTFTSSGATALLPTTVNVQKFSVG